MIRHLIGVVVLLLCIATASFSQVCDGPLTVTIEGSTTGIPLDVTGVATDSECNDQSGSLSGSVALTVAGGSPDYTFIWTNSETTEDISGLGAGTYGVTVTDDQGCTDTAEFVIAEPPEWSDYSDSKWRNSSRSI